MTDLVLSNNRLSSLVLPDPADSPIPSTSTSAPRHHLRQLRHLDLVDNLLDAWPSTVDALGASASNNFPALQSVRLRGNGVASSSSSSKPAISVAAAAASRRDPGSAPGPPPDLAHDLDSESSPDRKRSTPHARLLLVARLPYITELDGTPVSRAERDDAERFWVEQLAKGAEDETQLGDWARGRLRDVRRSASFAL